MIMENKKKNLDLFLDILDNPSEEGLNQFKLLREYIYNNNNNILKSIVIDILKREYIYNYIYGNLERAKNSKQIFKLFNLDIRPNIVLTIIYDNFWMLCEKDNNTARYKLKRELIDATNLLLEGIKSVATTLIGTDKVIVLIDCEGRSEKEAMKYVDKITNKLLINLHDMTKYSVSIGVSSYKKDEKNLNDAYEESFRALDNIFKKGKGSIVYNQNYGTIANEHLDLDKYLHDLIINIGHNNIETANEIIKRMYYFLRAKNYDSNYIKSISLIFIFEISNYFSFDENKDILNVVLMDNTESLLRTTTLNEIKAIIKKYLKTIVDYFEETNSIKRGVNVAKSYIEKYYMLDISLEKISFVAGFSPYYFSRNFKKITGSNYIDYLINIRIDNAKLLLSTTDKTILEISLEVGFENFSYFSGRFKKLCGTPPSEYRRIFKKTKI